VHVLSPGQKVTIYREKAPSSLTSQPQTAVEATLGNTAAMQPATSR